jgi:hypothetical protein
VQLPRFVPISLRDVLDRDSEIGATYAQTVTAMNEIQHSALGQMIAYLERRPDRYPDKHILKSLLVRAKKTALSGPAQRSLIGSIYGHSETDEGEEDGPIDP